MRGTLHIINIRKNKVQTYVVCVIIQDKNPRYIIIRFYRVLSGRF